MYDLVQSFLFSTLRISTPIIFVALCSCISSQAGLTNMAAEAMMLASALAGVMGSALTQNLFLGLLIGILTSVAVTLFICFASFVMKVDLYLMSISMNMALMGATVYVMFVTTGQKANTANYFASLSMPQIDIPLIKDIPFIGGIISGQNAFTYLAWIMVFVVWFLIFRTKIGLKIRAAGRNPQAAESVGINPRKMYTISFVLASVIASLGGMFLSMGYMNFFMNNMTGGKGFIGMAAATIGNASPLLSAIFAYVFGLSEAVTNYSKLVITDAQLLAALPYIITVVLIILLAVVKNKMEEKARKKRKQQALQRHITERN